MDYGNLDPEVGRLLRTYLEAVTLIEQLEGRLWQQAQLTLIQVRALRRLVRGPKSMGRLGAELSLPSPSVTRVIDRLEERGLAVRRRGLIDRRRVEVELLPAGARLARDLPFVDGSAVRLAIEEMSGPQRLAITKSFREFVDAVHATEARGDPRTNQVEELPA
jgi:DNA-binding MarR family transcriptional regulator